MFLCVVSCPISDLTEHRIDVKRSKYGEDDVGRMIHGFYSYKGFFTQIIDKPILMPFSWSMTRPKIRT